MRRGRRESRFTEHVADHPLAGGMWLLGFEPGLDVERGEVRSILQVARFGCLESARLVPRGPPGSCTVAAARESATTPTAASPTPPLRLRNFPKKVRRAALADLWRSAFPLLVTNQQRSAAAALLDHYARRMLIENQITDATRFFHMDPLSPSVLLIVDVDLHARLMGSSLYRLVAVELGRGHERAQAQMLFCKFMEGKKMLSGLWEAPLRTPPGRARRQPWRVRTLRWHARCARR